MEEMKTIKNKSQSGQTVSWPRLEPGTPKYWYKSRALLLYQFAETNLLWQLTYCSIIFCTTLEFRLGKCWVFFLCNKNSENVAPCMNLVTHAAHFLRKTGNCIDHTREYIHCKKSSHFVKSADSMHLHTFSIKEIILLFCPHMS